MNVKLKVRNYAAKSPLLRKGGAHSKTRKALRLRDKQVLRRELSRRPILD